MSHTNIVRRSEIQMIFSNIKKDRKQKASNNNFFYAWLKKDTAVFMYKAAIQW